MAKRKRKNQNPERLETHIYTIPHADKLKLLNEFGQYDFFEHEINEKLLTLGINSPTKAARIWRYWE